MQQVTEPHGTQVGGVQLALRCRINSEATKMRQTLAAFSLLGCFAVCNSAHALAFNWEFVIGDGSPNSGEYVRGTIDGAIDNATTTGNFLTVQVTETPTGDFLSHVWTGSQFGGTGITVTNGVVTFAEVAFSSGALAGLQLGGYAGPANYTPSIFDLNIPITWTNRQGQVTFSPLVDDPDGDLTGVPEPAILALFGVGLMSYRVARRNAAWQPFESKQVNR